SPLISMALGFLSVSRTIDPWSVTVSPLRSLYLSPASTSFVPASVDFCPASSAVTGIQVPSSNFLSSLSCCAQAFAANPTKARTTSNRAYMHILPRVSGDRTDPADCNERLASPPAQQRCRRFHRIRGHRTAHALAAGPTEDWAHVTPTALALAARRGERPRHRRPVPPAGNRQGPHHRVDRRHPRRAGPAARSAEAVTGPLAGPGHGQLDARQAHRRGPAGGRGGGPRRPLRRQRRPGGAVRVAQAQPVVQHLRHRRG